MMEGQLFESALIYGGLVMTLIAAAKNFVPQLTGGITLVATLILSGLFAWYYSSSAVPTPDIPSTVMLGVMTFGVAVGAWSGANKIASKVGKTEEPKP